jgi:carbon-monoxide dehydrogenase small subunit
MTDRLAITLDVNGQSYPVTVEPRKSLADALREDCGLTGTHLGCEHGVCGACTVIVDGRPVRSCLMFAVQAEGLPVRTVEGLAEGETLHPLQRHFWEQHGLQCGFCTPGMVMSAVDLVQHHDCGSEAAIREGLEGNLCRCTGYQNIVRAVQAGAQAMKEA